MHGSHLPTAQRTAAVARLRRIVAKACDRDAVIRPAETVLLACSGGADSTAMLDACIYLAAPRGWTLQVAHIDHGLRPSAVGDADAVAEMCLRSGIPLHRRSLHMEPGPGVQERARGLRYAALREIATQVGASVIATAHTADDQAETVLMRALSQATPRSLRGMADRGEDLARPLLGAWRSETRDYCRELDLRFIDDPANTDPRYTRSRVRHELLPALEQVFPATRRRLVALAAGQRAAAPDHAEDSGAVSKPVQ